MSNVSATIRTIRDIMRKDIGVDGDAQHISQMVWMLFIKIFSDKEAEWKKNIKSYKSPIPDELKWRQWAANPDGLTHQVSTKCGFERLTFPTVSLFLPDL
jgi:type I restriction enzyme M protein